MARPSQSLFFNFVGLPGFNIHNVVFLKQWKSQKGQIQISNFLWSKSQKKIRKPNAFKKSQICGFWLKKSQYGNPSLRPVWC